MSESKYLWVDLRCNGQSAIQVLSGPLIKIRVDHLDKVIVSHLRHSIARDDHDLIRYFPAGRNRLRNRLGLQLASL